MPDSVLDLLKLVLLVLLYLFFARVLWAVWSEVRQPANVRSGSEFAPTPVIPAQAGSASTPPTPAASGSAAKRGSEVPGRLLVLEPKDRKGAAYAVNERGFTIGREDDNALRIADDSYLSGHHARFDYVDGKLMVTDLGSRNGTFLNGVRLTDPRPVRPGDRIQIGYTVFEAQR
jgi:pSer/pThr/pTyr-binding forkhead associated (FHA) protein